VKNFFKLFPLGRKERRPAEGGELLPLPEKRGKRIGDDGKKGKNISSTKRKLSFAGGRPVPFHKRERLSDVRRIPEKKSGGKESNTSSLTGGKNLAKKRKVAANSSAGKRSEVKL